MTNLNQNEGQEKEDILLVLKPDRRLLSKVPDKTGLRTVIDRRSTKVQQATDDFFSYMEREKAGQRYVVSYDIIITYETKQQERKTCHGKGVDLSATGILIEIPVDFAQELQEAAKIRLKFEIVPGTMPEGYEMKVDIGAKYIRLVKPSGGEVFCGLEFEESLAEYAVRKRNRYVLAISSACLFFITFFIVLMRAESVIYFKFNQYLYFYSIIAATFLLTRYLFGSFYRTTPIDKNFTPGVTIIIPCFNEEKWIRRTILSCLNQAYPIDQLEVLVVDDCSNDRSVEKIREVIEEIKSKEERYEVAHRLNYIVQKVNKGKREALARGALMAKHDLIVFVDSDSFLDPFAILNIVQPFKDKKMGGVSGRTDVANTYTNVLTKMQAVRYFIAFRIMKAAEGYFDAVTCLSGPLSCYRKDLVLTYLDAWLNQKFLGQRATFGDDRSMTNFILRHHRTGYQDSALCYTIVPNQYKLFLKQQMRWKRSWLRESLIAASFMWKKEPFMSLSFYMGLIVPIAAPIIVLYNLIYVPLMHRVFPTTFILGIFFMAMLMSMAQLFLRKSSTWIFGFWFCLYYEAVLLWQMPVAWFTFWKSTWGTRMTPSDLAELAKQNERKQKRA
ncbi:glycosyltransferase family 2 protein [Anaerosinus massiliensis]|uniref:glycosyltransferase family 2 protein n=1 Tax=Massilibacillus massiliensis TaxID=1806837 RepID=UPI000AEE0DF4|nr:glycosyltransferase [Massilibacillus massiliensis]